MGWSRQLFVGVLEGFAGVVRDLVARDILFGLLAGWPFWVGWQSHPLFFFSRPLVAGSSVVAFFGAEVNRFVGAPEQDGY